jgi:hypothetical protein
MLWVMAFAFGIAGGWLATTAFLDGLKAWGRK